MERKALGGYGEGLAIGYLKKEGYKLLAKNYRSLRCEVDAVMQEGETLVFVEVKTRRTGGYGAGREAVTPQKQKNIIKAAQCYLQAYQCYHRQVRFDVVEVQLPSKDIIHIKNAFGV